MNFLTTKIKTRLLMIVASAAIFSSCSKDLEKLPDNGYVQPGGLSLAETVATTQNDTLYSKLIIRAGMTSTLSATTSAYTLFVADNNVVKSFVTAASGGAVPLTAPNSTFAAFIATTLPASTAAGIVNYYLVPQKFTTSAFVHPFPNLELPTNLVAIPGNTLARLRMYVSKNPSTGFFYTNNIPLIGTDLIVGNSVIHHLGALVPPPQRMVWERVNTDADLTIFKAAVQRADSGVAVTSPASLIGGMLNFGANFTVLAPSNAAMKATISALTGGLIPVAAPDATFIGFLGSNGISTLMVKGIVVYHLLGTRTTVGGPVSTIRAFTVNVPTTPTPVLTLLNSPGPAQSHPGVVMQATYTGPVAATVTVKGLGNATAASVALNSTPDLTPSYGATPPAIPVVYTGTSDQHYVNGVLHKINQVLLPQ